MRKFARGWIPNKVGNDEAPFDRLRANGKRNNGYLKSYDLRPESPQMLRSISKAFDTRMNF